MATSRRCQVKHCSFGLLCSRLNFMGLLSPGSVAEREPASRRQGAGATEDRLAGPVQYPYRRGALHVTGIVAEGLAPCRETAAAWSLKKRLVDGSLLFQRFDSGKAQGKMRGER